MFGEQMINSMTLATILNNITQGLPLLFDRDKSEKTPSSKPLRLEQTQTARMVEEFSDSATPETHRLDIAGGYEYGFGSYYNQVKKDQISLEDRAIFALAFMKVAQNASEPENIRASAIDTVIHTVGKEVALMRHDAAFSKKYSESKGETPSEYLVSLNSQLRRVSDPVSQLTKGLENIMEQPSTSETLKARVRMAGKVMGLAL